MSKLPRFIKQKFEEQLSIERTRLTTSNSIELYPTDGGFVGVEWVRDTGQEILDGGYAVTALREHKTYTEVWFDEVSDVLDE